MPHTFIHHISAKDIQLQLVHDASECKYNKAKSTVTPQMLQIREKKKYLESQPFLWCVGCGRYREFFDKMFRLRLMGLEVLSHHRDSAAEVMKD
jgi:hypothetical protein